jgi:hypothetical protein
VSRQHADVERTLAMIDSLRRSLDFVAAHLGDVHLLAYEKPVGERSGGSGSGVSRPTESTLLPHRGGYVDGEPPPPTPGEKARAVCAALGVSSGRGLASRTATDWGKVESDIMAVIGGPGAGALRGTLIGAEEYREAVAAQKRRTERAGDPATEHLAEYEPVRARGMTQPGYPAPRSRAKPKAAEEAPPKRGWHR